RDEERLREEALDLAGAGYGRLVLLRELVHAEDGDDVLQLLVALQHALHVTGALVVLLAHDRGGEDGGGGVERIDRRVDAQLRDGAREHRGGVEVGERGSRRRIGEIVGGHVDRLDGRDRALVGGGDALLQAAHLRRQGRLITD